MVYLLIGEDPLSKDLKLKKIKEEYLSKAAQDFNLDLIYAKETSLKSLQEKILTLAIKAKKRMIIIKEAHQLKEDAREFIFNYAKGASHPAILVLDMPRQERKDEFVNRISRYAQVSYFKDVFKPDAFFLWRQIEIRKMGEALMVLNRLLDEGEKPERIIGGLRYAWERGNTFAPQAGKKLKALINCDIDIKTGRLRPDFALEKLVIRLCSLGRV